SGSKEVSRLELLTVEKLIDTTGRSIKLANEMEIDKSTGISGSGPAYVFYFMESMMEAAIKMGFREADARLMVAQTFQGAVELFNSSGLKPAAGEGRSRLQGRNNACRVNFKGTVEPLNRSRSQSLGVAGSGRLQRRYNACRVRFYGRK